MRGEVRRGRVRGPLVASRRCVPELPLHSLVVSVE